jgi:hypothetical protein
VPCGRALAAAVCSVFCVLCAFAVAACSGGGSRSTASTTNVPTSRAKQHVVSLSLANATELAWRRAAVERCKADPMVTAVVVTSVVVTPTSSDAHSVKALQFGAEYRCSDLLAKRHVVSVSLTDAPLTAMRDAAAGRCKADPTVTAVAVTSTFVETSTTRGPSYRIQRRVEYRCNDLR